MILRIQNNFITLLGTVTALLLSTTALSADSGTNSLSKAWNEVAYLNFRMALPLFENTMKDSPENSAISYEAKLGLALCLHQQRPDTQNDKLRAAKLYDELITSSSNSHIRATALLLRGRLFQLADYPGDQPDPANAATLYHTILQDYPDSPCANEAALYLAQTAIFTMNVNAASNAVGNLKQWIIDHPRNPQAANQWMLIGMAQQQPLNNINAAIDAYTNAISCGLPPEEKKDILYWRIASMAQKCGRTNLARDFYSRIITEIKRSSYSFMAQQRIREMGFKPPPLINPFDN